MDDRSPAARGDAASRASAPARTLSVGDAVFVIVGIVIGAGIFRAPSVVAANTTSDLAMLLVWVAGGLIALVGALCYAELASTYPSTGGDYHFLHRAFGRRLAFLFAWARATVMQTGSIALLAYVFGDYAQEIWPLGAHGPALYAAAAVIAFTAVNLAGRGQGIGTQRAFTLAEVAGVSAIAVAGLVLGSHALPGFGAEQALAATLGSAGDTGAAAVAGGPGAAGGEPAPAPAATAARGRARGGVMLTYGGWNEAAYLSAEVRGERAPIARALFVGIGVVTVLYLLANLAYLRGLGHAGMAESSAIGADLMRAIWGEGGATLVAALIAIAALTSLNATVITGARTNHALGVDFPRLGFLAHWDARRQAPVAALWVQGGIALALVLLGSLTRSGFTTLVEYTAPVFWAFFALTGLALFRLRRVDPARPRPFRVPLYPLTPVAFVATSLYMLWSSLNYSGLGAFVGVAVLAAGVPALWFCVAGEGGRPAPGREA
jgi:amino acid transporter